MSGQELTDEPQIPRLLEFCQIFGKLFYSMKLLKALGALLILMAIPSAAQESRAYVVWNTLANKPTSCPGYQLFIATDQAASAALYGCLGGTFQLMGGGSGGSGTVTSTSAGNLSPLFTTNVATASSTPAITFTLSTAAANTVFGNFTGSAAAPGFTAAPTFSGANLTNLPASVNSIGGQTGAFTLTANQICQATTTLSICNPLTLTSGFSVDSSANLTGVNTLGASGLITGAGFTATSTTQNGSVGWCLYLTPFYCLTIAMPSISSAFTLTFPDTEANDIFATQGATQTLSATTLKGGIFQDVNGFTTFSASAGAGTPSAVTDNHWSVKNTGSTNIPALSVTSEGSSANTNLSGIINALGTGSLTFVTNGVTSAQVLGSASGNATYNNYPTLNGAGTGAGARLSCVAGGSTGDAQCNINIVGAGTAPLIILANPVTVSQYLKLTEIAAPAGAAGVGQIYADSTQHTVSVNNNNTGPMPVSRVACVNVTPATVNANISTFQVLMTCNLSANLLNVAGRTLRVSLSGVYSNVVTAVPTVTLGFKLCSVSGACSSGTVITPLSIVSTATSATSVSNLAASISGYITTQTAGASSAYESHGELAIDLGTTGLVADSIFRDTNTAAVGTIDNTAATFLTAFVTFSGASTSNSFTARQLIVEALN